MNLAKCVYQVIYVDGVWGPIRLRCAKIDKPTIMRTSAHQTVAMVLRHTYVDGKHIDIAAATLRKDFAGSTHREFTRVVAQI